MRKFSALNIIFLLTFLISCDYPNHIHYVVSNQTKDSLALKFAYRTNFLSDEIKDSAIVIFGSRKVTLFTLGMTSASVFNPELSDTMKHISDIVFVRISDNASVRKNILLKKNWEFNKKGRNVAVLELVINDSDFEVVSILK